MMNLKKNAASAVVSLSIASVANAFIIMPQAPSISTAISGSSFEFASSTQNGWVRNTKRSRAAPLQLSIKTEDSTSDEVQFEVDSQSFNPFNFTDNDDVLVRSSSLQQLSDGDAEQEMEDEKKDPSIWVARALLLAVAALWGTNFASVKYLETLCYHPPCNHPPSEFAFARFGLAALVSLPLLINQQKDVILGGLECGLWISLGYITQANALETVASSDVAFICSLTVVIVPLMSAVLLGTKIKPTNVISAALALAGVGTLEGLFDLPSLLGGAQPALADTSAIVSTAAVDSIASTSSVITASASSIVSESSVGWLASLESMGISKGDLLALGQPIGFGFSFIRIEHYVEKFKDVENRIRTMAAAECMTIGTISLLWVLYDYGGHLPNFEYMVRIICYYFSTAINVMKVIQKFVVYAYCQQSLTSAIFDSISSIRNSLNHIELLQLFGLES